MHIVVIGGTGTTGKLVIREAIKRGHTVTTYVRRPEAINTQEKLNVVAGNITDIPALTRTFNGADAVISCLGVRPSLKAFFKPSTLQQEALPAIIQAINNAKVPRFVLMSSFGSGKSRNKGAWFIRTFLYSFIAKKMFDDKAAAEQSLNTCRANWTAVYPVMLQKMSAVAEAELVELEQVTNVPGVPQLPFINAAHCLVDLARNTEYANKKLLLTTKGGWR